jgi:hypothetical protein
MYCQFVINILKFASIMEQPNTLSNRYAISNRSVLYCSQRQNLHVGTYGHESFILWTYTHYTYVLLWNIVGILKFLMYVCNNVALSIKTLLHR